MSTPVQRQYWELKNKNPDAVLFFRLGDFYEIFFEDAKICSRILGIALTARHRGTDNEMPMCGFPHHAHKEYLEKMIESGYKVAIAEQFEDEDKKITRKVTRVVTPGTSQEEGNLDQEKNSFLLAIGYEKKQWALAYSDFTTGEFRTCSCEDEVTFWDELYKVNPREILVPSTLMDDNAFVEKLPKTHITVRKDLKQKKADEVLKSHFQVQNLDVFGLEKVSLLITVSAQILEYLQETQQTKVSHISKIDHYSPNQIMQLDAQAYRHLEIFEPIYQDENTATLWSVFEKSFTAMGARRLRYFLENPLMDAKKIQQRLESVEEVLKKSELKKGLREGLQRISDLERILARMITGRGNPRDLAFFRDSFRVFPQMKTLCEKADSEILKENAKVFGLFEAIQISLETKLIEHPPVEMMSGGIFQDGVSKELDEYRTLSQNGKQWLDDFLNQKKEETGIQNLRIKYSKNFGFCLEVSTANANKAPSDWVRRQTLVNAERFTTPDLVEYEEKTLSAESKACELEYTMFESLRQAVVQKAHDIQAVAQSIGMIDALVTVSRTASKWRWNKPDVHEKGAKFIVRDGRHPVVEKISTEVFIANDLTMSEKSCMHLITGPNMAGKSTFLRQNALLILLAQIGSFVPAQKMRLTPFDRIFTRVGASDNLAGGKSTFFVEMTETARILRTATEKSFVILDEVGRGTSTFDGISLAWAITEFLHNTTKSKTLFATHYHELIDLADELQNAQNFHVTVSQNKNGIVFLRKIHEGGISDSFGIEVAETAGVPKSVTQSARLILSRLESDNTLKSQPTLFSTPRIREKIIEVQTDSAVEKKLETQNLEELTPKQALDFLYELKEKGQKEKNRQ
jgi:DNA mismatch repair protein MutS